MSAMAQTDNQPTESQVASTDLSRLPGLLKLKQSVPSFSAQDESIAIGLIKRWLREQQKDFPVDCQFKVRGPIEQIYELGEDRATVEARLRKLNQGFVAFSQFNEWREFPKDAVGFQKPNSLEWQQFEQSVLPRIVDSFQKAYYQPAPAGLFRLDLKGFQSICGEIKEYLQSRFKAKPDAITCSRSEDFERKLLLVRKGLDETISASMTIVTLEGISGAFYKLSHPYADGLVYSQLAIEGCQFESPPALLEKALAEPKAPIKAKTTPQQKEAPPRQKSEKQMERDARRKEAADLKEWESKQKAERLEWERNEKEKIRKSELLIEDSRIKEYYPQANPSQAEVIAHSELGEALKKGYKKFHKAPWVQQPEFDVDEKKLNQLKGEISKSEEEWTQEFNQRNPDRPLDFKKVVLDEKDPFSFLRIPVAIELTSYEIQSLIRSLQKQNHKWILGCRPVSMIKKDQDGNELPQKTYIDCLVPNFVVESHDPNAPPRVLNIPVPAIVDSFKDIKNQCDVSIGTKTGRGLGIKEVPLLRSRGQTQRVDSAYQALKTRQVPSEIDFSAGIRSKTIDAFTKKVIPGAKVTVRSRDHIYSALTDPAGRFTIDPLQLKGLDRRMLGQHRKYNDGLGVIQKIVIDQVSDQADIFLEPKRVTVSGKISETFHPKFGSGLKGLRVGFDGYEAFQTETDENGGYIIKNVPASLVDFFVTDLTTGHQPLTAKLDLNPDEANEHVDFSIVPNLTEVEGQVTSRGEPIAGLQVVLPEFPSFSTITDENGRYRFSDVPQNTSKVEVLTDPEVIYIGKEESIQGFRAYKKHVQNLQVKYNRSDITGRVYDVLTKKPVVGVKVYVEGGESKYSCVTDAYGAYKIKKVPATATTLLLKSVAPNYIWRPRKITPQLIPGEDRDNQDFRLVPRDYIKNDVVFILTWNQKQYDLDSQLFLPDGRHLYFKTLHDNSFSSKGGATLDKDDTGTAGRETTVIFKKDGKFVQPGTYRFLVFQYVFNNLSFQEADALIEIYKDGEFFQEVKPGPGKGRVWFVGSVNDGDFKLIDQFPAGELYEKLDKLEREKIANADLPRSEEIAYNSLVNQESTLVTNQTALEAKLAQLKADLESVKQGAEPVLEIVPPPLPAPKNPPVVSPPPVSPSPVVTPVPAPRVLTQAEKIEIVSKSIKKCEKDLAGVQAQLSTLRDQVAKKRTYLDGLPQWIENRKQQIDNEKASIENRIQEILSTYQ